VRSNEGIASAVATARQHVDIAASTCGVFGDGPVVEAMREAPAELLDTALRSVVG